MPLPAGKGAGKRRSLAEITAAQNRGQGQKGEEIKHRLAQACPSLPAILPVPAVCPLSSILFILFINPAPVPRALVAFFLINPVTPVSRLQDHTFVASRTAAPCHTFVQQSIVTWGDTFCRPVTLTQPLLPHGEGLLQVIDIRAGGADPDIIHFVGSEEPSRERRYSCLCYQTPPGRMGGVKGNSSPLSNPKTSPGRRRAVPPPAGR